MMRDFISRVVSRVKKEPFILDPKVPLSVVAAMLSERLIMRLRGLFLAGKQGPVYLGAGCTIRSRSKIRFGANVTIQRGCRVDALSSEGVLFGDNVSLQRKSVIECSGTLKNLGKGLVVGDNVGIGSHSYLGCAGGISIGNDTIIGNFVSFHAENHNYADPDIPIRLQGVNRKGIVVGRNCWIGAKATILDGAVIRDGCIVAAGAVVTQGMYESNSILAGVPAKMIGKRC